MVRGVAVSGLRGISDRKRYSHPPWRRQIRRAPRAREVRGKSPATRGAERAACRPPLVRAHPVRQQRRRPALRAPDELRVRDPLIQLGELLQHQLEGLDVIEIFEHRFVVELGRCDHVGLTLDAA
jgi:hypothetical protein